MLLMHLTAFLTLRFSLEIVDEKEKIIVPLIDKE